ncbi:MAG: hypothetical protein ACHQFX_09735 [Chitinophagales bacterium]
MRFIISVLFFLSFCTFVMGQRISQIKWYSESASKGVIIQNSFPKGGPYIDSAGKYTGYSFLIFFTRVINETASPLELTINFPADSFATGDWGNVYLKLFLPPDTMTFDKESLYNYGVTGLESFLDFNKPTMLERTINPKEEFLFYTGTVFYQARGTERTNRPRGGNRAELVLHEQDLFYRMVPQIDSLPCGHIIIKK